MVLLQSVDVMVILTVLTKRHSVLSCDNLQQQLNRPVSITIPTIGMAHSSGSNKTRCAFMSTHAHMVTVSLHGVT